MQQNEVNTVWIKLNRIGDDDGDRSEDGKSKAS